MKKYYLYSVSVIFILIFISAPAVGKEEEKLCLSNVCIGDDINSLKTDWIDLRKNKRFKIHIRKIEIEGLSDIHRHLLKDISFEENNRSAILPYIINGMFDSYAIKLLKSVKAFCKEYVLNGIFLSKSGYITIVTIAPFFDNISDTLHFKVVNIIRYYKAIDNVKLSSIKVLLGDKYSDICEYSGSYSDNLCPFYSIFWLKNLPDKHPLKKGLLHSIFLGMKKEQAHMGNYYSYFEIHGMNYKYIDRTGLKGFSEEYINQLQKHPFCHNKIKNVSIN